MFYKKKEKGPIWIEVTRSKGQKKMLKANKKERKIELSLFI